MANEGVFIYDIDVMRRLQKVLRVIGRDVGKLDRPLKRWGAYMLQETGRTFDKSGRGPVKWKPLSAMTLALRKHRGRGANPKRILQLTGHLKRATQTHTITRGGMRAQQLINRVPYATDHQYGATKRRPEQVIVPKHKKALHFWVGAGRSGAQYEVFAKKVVQPARDYQIPQRKFLFILPKDQDKSIELFEEHAVQVAKKHMRDRRSH
jgi:phage gpG-like protein